MMRQRKRRERGVRRGAREGEKGEKIREVIEWESEIGAVVA